jgi:hypothetical protein
VQIASSSGDLTPLAVDSGRVLVREGSDTLVILDAAGAELSRLTVPDFTEASLQGSDVVVHSGGDLDDYDAATGALLHAWPVPADAHLEDVQVGVAAYVTGSAVHLLRLSHGRYSVVTAPGTGPIHAQLEPQGLFYSYSVADSERPGRLAFVPSAALPSTK